MSADPKLLGTLTAQCARIGLTLTVTADSGGRPLYVLSKGAWSRQTDDLNALAYAVAMRTGRSPTEALEQLQSRLRVDNASFRTQYGFARVWVPGNFTETYNAEAVAASITKAAALAAP